MKSTLKKLRSRIEGDVLPASEHRSVVLSEHALRKINGGIEPDNQGSTPSCCPCADDCMD